MAKDPKYDRYAGMVTLPGDPLNPRKPRPFRVDEDGNVIYLDEEAGRARPAGGANARAGILDWDELDRRAGERSAPLTATAVRGSAAKGDKGSDVVRTRKTIGGSDYYVINANTYDPALSNGVTSIPNEDMISIWNTHKNQVAVKGGKVEKGAYTIALPIDFSVKTDDPPNERNLSLLNPKPTMYYPLPVINTKTGSTDQVDTFSFGRPNEWPIGTVGLSHGHIDGTSEGMADYYDLSTDPKIYGDIGSLLGNDPVPTATVSEGDVGWHQLENGRLQFVYPARELLEENEAKRAAKRAKMIQENLDRQQLLFQRKMP
ncbi:hypothetical protein [Sphingomonas sp. YL-JM2C]